EEKENASKRRIEKQRKQVRARKRLRSKQLERNHRRGAPYLDDAEPDERRYSDTRGANHRRVRPPTRRRNDQRVDDASEAERAKHRPLPIEPRCSKLVPTLRYAPEQQCEYEPRKGEIHEECPTPEPVVRERAAEHRTDRRRHGGEAGPGA